MHFVDRHLGWKCVWLGSQGSSSFNGNLEFWIPGGYGKTSTWVIKFIQCSITLGETAIHSDISIRPNYWMVPTSQFLTEIYCHMPPTRGLQVTVARGHRWKAPKHARIAHWLKPPTYWVALEANGAGGYLKYNCLSQAFVNYYTDYTFTKITQMLTTNA